MSQRNQDQTTQRINKHITDNPHIKNLTKELKTVTQQSQSIGSLIIQKSLGKKQPKYPEQNSQNRPKSSISEERKH